MRNAAKNLRKRTCNVRVTVCRMAQKSRQLENSQKNYYIVFNPANEIRFIREIKVSSTVILSMVLNILRVTYFVTSITMLDPKSSDMHHIR